MSGLTSFADFTAYQKGMQQARKKAATLQRDPTYWKPNGPQLTGNPNKGTKATGYDLPLNHTYGRTVDYKAPPPAEPKRLLRDKLNFNYRKDTKIFPEPTSVRVDVQKNYKEGPNFVPFTVEAPPLRL